MIGRGCATAVCQWLPQRISKSRSWKSSLGPQSQGLPPKTGVVIVLVLGSQRAVSGSHPTLAAHGGIPWGRAPRLHTGCLWPRLPFPPCSSCLAMKPIQERKAWVCDPIVVETTVPKALSSSGGEMIPDSCSFLFLTDLRRRLEPGTGSRVARVPAPALPCARWVTVVRFPSALFCASISPVCENRYENSTLPPGVLRGCKDWFVHSPQDSASFLEEGQYHPHNYCWSAAAVAVCSVGYLYEV